MISKRGLPCFLLLVACGLGANATANFAGHSLRLYGTARSSLPPQSPLRKLDGALADVHQSYTGLGGAEGLAALHVVHPAARFRVAIPQAIPQVAVDAVTTGDPQLLLADLQGLGLQQAAVARNDVGGWLPVDRIADAAALAELNLLRAAMPRARTGSVTSQGDFVVGSDTVRTNDALDGSGITVGVLSDSFNCYSQYAQEKLQTSGGEGYAPNGFIANAFTDVSTGDLPSNVDVIEEGSCQDYQVGVESPFSDEGRAILQIVHDVAPGAGLSFYTAFNSEADFANGIHALASAGAKVIDDDVGYPDEPMYQDGLIAQAVEAVAAGGVSYFSSAGNNGSNAYENATPAFPVTSTAAQNNGEKLLNFDASGASTRTSLPLTIAALQPGEFVNLIVQWDQPYVTGSPNSGGARNQLDLCVSGNTVDEFFVGNGTSGTSIQCTGTNPTGSDPVLILTAGNPASATGATQSETVNVQIGLVSGSVPGRIRLMVDDDGAGSTINAFMTNSPTLQGHPGAAGAAAVGAADYFDTPACGKTPAELETYSSQGGDPILFDTSGHRLAAAVVRQKPDFVGPDGVNNTFLGDQNKQQVMSTIEDCKIDVNLPLFFGTSAAAPHASGVAALMLQFNPSATPAQIIGSLTSTALPMGNKTPNFSSGAGLIQAVPALAQVPEPTSSSSGGSSGGGSGSSSGGSSGITSSGGGGGSADPALCAVLLAGLGLRQRRRLRPPAGSDGSQSS